MRCSHACQVSTVSSRQFNPWLATPIPVPADSSGVVAGLTKISKPHETLARAKNYVFAHGNISLLAKMLATSNSSRFYSTVPTGIRASQRIFFKINRQITRAGHRGRRRDRALSVSTHIRRCSVSTLPPKRSSPVPWHRTVSRQSIAGSAPPGPPWPHP